MNQIIKVGNEVSEETKNKLKKLQELKRSYEAAKLGAETLKKTCKENKDQIEVLEREIFLQISEHQRKMKLEKIVKAPVLIDMDELEKEEDEKIIKKIVDQAKIAVELGQPVILSGKNENIKIYSGADAEKVVYDIEATFRTRKQINEFQQNTIRQGIFEIRSKKTESNQSKRHDNFASDYRKSILSQTI